MVVWMSSSTTHSNNSKCNSSRCNSNKYSSKGTGTNEAMLVPLRKASEPAAAPVAPSF